MTQAIANDPIFAELAKELQENALTGGMSDLSIGGAEPAGAPEGMPAMMPGVDPNKYMEAMQRVMENPDFLKAAEDLGRNLMSQSMPPEMMDMMSLFQNPENHAIIQEKLEELKDDPELADVFKDIEQNGQSAMFKYFDKEEIVVKFNSKFKEVMDDPRLHGAALEGGQGGEGGDEEAQTLRDFASNGDDVGLKEALKQEGINADEADEEGRTALHFASGYSELACMELLLDAGANINAVDANQNTALHYAAGYGNVDATKVLVKRGADLTAKNEEGKTALEVAEMNEQEDVVAVLKA